jgi:hypothetical protein
VHAETTQLDHEVRIGPHSCSCAVIPVVVRRLAVRISGLQGRRQQAVRDDDASGRQMRVRIDGLSRRRGTRGRVAQTIRSAQPYVGRDGCVTVSTDDEESLQIALERMRESDWLKAPATRRDKAFG